jgi:hypothetical protein
LWRSGVSRFNQFTGFAGKLNVKGTETVEGRMVYNAANPVILSWVARCRLQAKESGLQVVTKHLNTDILRATWTWQFNQEVLDVEVFSTPEVRKIIAEQQEKPTFADPVENKSSDEPPELEEVLPAPLLEEIQIENGLPPIPPQLIKTLVVLSDNKYCVVYDMRSLEKGLSTQKPLIKNFETQGDWTLPDETLVPRLRDYYFGNMNYDRFQAGRFRDTLPYCLQMTNSLVMGPVAISGVSFSGGGFQQSGAYTVYRLKGGLKSNAQLRAKTNIGQIGCGGGFPALMATDNMIYACTQTFTLSDPDLVNNVPAQLELYGDLDGYEYGSWLQDDFGVPEQIDVVPNFIDRNGDPCYEIGTAFFVNQPSSGALLWFQNFPDTVWGKESDFISPPDAPTTSTGKVTKPKFSQIGGIDILEAEEIDVTSFDDGATAESTLTAGSFTSNRTGSWGHVHWAAIISVPYPPANEFTFYGGGDDPVVTTFLGPSAGPYIIPTNSNPGSSYEVFNGFMQVSNGEHNLQGFVFHSTSWSGFGFSAKFPLTGGQYYFYLDGQDATADLESACETSADKIQYAFMDVPLYSAVTIKKVPRT